MTLTDTLTALENAPFATAIRQGSNLFPWIESVHVLAVVMLVGVVALMDLRLVGATRHEQKTHHLLSEILPYAWAAFAVAATTGFLLFSSSAVSYADNLPFRIKAVALVVAGVNIAIFHLFTERGSAAWDERRLPGAARGAGLISLICWTAVVAAGRWIGFVS